MDALEVCFWLCAACVAYVYVGYALILGLAAKLWQRSPARDIAYAPSVSFVVAAHNEEEAITRRLDELTGLLKASGLTGEVIVVSDGSTDGTAAVAQSHPVGFVRVLELPARSGKAVALSAGCAAAAYDLLVFADVRQPWDAAARRMLVENFADPSMARSRVERWVRDYPRQFGRFRDSDGRPPRHTFFYPIEEYEAEYLDLLAELCRAGFGEVEMHLHHHNDTAANFREQLLTFRALLAERHGLLARRRDTGELAYGFIHGNWALCNSHPGGINCGVNNELSILRETGCYADFTMPSAPHRTQTRKINSMYYARDRPGRAWSHDSGRDAGAGPAPADALLLIQGPLVFDWRKRRLGVVPRLENGCIQGSQPARIERLASWLKARVQVPARPDWFFVKLHAHGAPENSHEALLGAPMVRFHEDLARRAAEGPRFHYHYVTAREMYNLVKAAEAGWTGSVAEARDYELLWNGAPEGERADSSVHEPINQPAR